MNDCYRYISKFFKIILLVFSLFGCAADSGIKQDSQSFIGNIKQGLSQSKDSFCSNSSEGSDSNKGLLGMKKGYCINKNTEGEGLRQFFGISDHELKKLGTVLIQIIPFYIFKH